MLTGKEDSGIIEARALGGRLRIGEGGGHEESCESHGVD